MPPNNRKKQGGGESAATLTSGSRASLEWWFSLLQEPRHFPPRPVNTLSGCSSHYYSQTHVYTNRPRYNSDAKITELLLV